MGSTPGRARGSAAVDLRQWICGSGFVAVAAIPTVVRIIVICDVAKRRGTLPSNLERLGGGARCRSAGCFFIFSWKKIVGSQGSGPAPLQRHMKLRQLFKFDNRQLGLCCNATKVCIQNVKIAVGVVVDAWRVENRHASRRALYEI
ncbi:hypothetical protein J2848_003545 [Azospirillum lipoferum]|uniref:Uncharacterized protein n=1 Tax=Azospirillum lipoferum TaxID=193 RepID=A0A5A9GLL8_AZOLI|nr:MULTISPECIES: hypothetical protein [Azospirillum]KAA0595253.1 hypothetical protein FZ942_16595 [Azospirillum lipoferum]MCP1611867.1 hypothetical protein [Azospirillum lipoferum]MDW5533374.1 hypothetical protein [Azospirillum sp. NL1]